MSRAQPSARERDNRRMLAKLSFVALAMFGFGYALVPFYDRICQALGVNNFIAPDAVAANTQVDLTRSVTIELDANMHNLAWRFRPMVRHVNVHPGQLVQVEYEIANVRSVPVTAQAVPSYGPQRAGQYFRKLECFCFTQQTLAAGETRRMPVVFVVDHSLPKDVNTITLSYTFFEVAGMSKEKILMAGAFDTVKAVLFGMLGVRRKADHDAAPLNPVHVIVAGVVMAVLFVLTLVTIVRIVAG